MGANYSMARPSRLARVGRSVLVAGASTLIALLSHVLAGGAFPELAGILVPFGLAVIIGLPLAGRLRSLPRLIAAVLISQLLYHWLFVLGAGSSGVLATDAGAHAGHGGAPLLVGAIPEAAAADLMMWASHGLAALVTILLIRRGDTALLGLRRLVMLLARAILPAQPRTAPLAVAAARRTSAGAPVREPMLLLLAETVTRRGPPRTRAAATA